jgi:thioredoxin-like negative regulator of GroEL
MLFAILVATAAPLPSFQVQDPRVAYTEITQADYFAAEAKLVRELRAHPYEPELMLNLAAVYAKTGRLDQARALYTRVLAQPQAELALGATRSTWSHQVAQIGLRMIDTSLQLSAR